MCKNNFKKKYFIFYSIVSIISPLLELTFMLLIKLIG